MAIAVTGSSEEIARQPLALYFDPDRGVVPKQAELDVSDWARSFNSWLKQANSNRPCRRRSGSSTCNISRRRDYNKIAPTGKPPRQSFLSIT